MLQGGIDKLKDAGAVVIGGHSIKNKEIKFGFAVTGLIHPKKIIANDKAKPGDVLILTKPIGTGAICFAGQLKKASPSWIAEISRSMVELNKAAAEVMVKAGVRTATDVTGFGLAGHLSEIAVQSGITAEVFAASVPVFEGALECFRQGMISGAVERNREYASKFVEKDGDIGEALEALLYDPQTSGGLLMCVPKAKAGAVLKELHKKGVKHATVIGRIKERSAGRIILKKK
jgi:selenide,water dikinase